MWVFLQQYILNISVVAYGLLSLVAEGMMWERRTVVEGWKGSLAAGCGVCGVVRGCAMGLWVPSSVQGSLSKPHGRGMQAEVGLCDNCNALPP